MMIPCTVVVVNSVEVPVRTPSYPIVALKIIPARWGIKQIAKVLGDTKVDAFRLSCADGSNLTKGRYVFTLSLYEDKGCTVNVSSVTGDYDGDGTLTFPAQATLAGSFYYTVKVANSAGDEQVLLTDSYIVKKPA